jgi:hypothetical protein
MRSSASALLFLSSVSAAVTMKPSVVRTQRRAVLGSALAAVAISPWPASAKSSGTAKYASGYVAPKSPAEVKAEVLALHVQPYVAAYASKDWTGDTHPAVEPSTA